MQDWDGVSWKTLFFNVHMNDLSIKLNQSGIGEILVVI